MLPIREFALLGIKLKQQDKQGGLKLIEGIYKIITTIFGIYFILGLGFSIYVLIKIKLKKWD